MDELLALHQKFDNATIGLVMLANNELQELQASEDPSIENMYEKETQTETVTESENIKVDSSVQTTEALGETLEMKRQQLYAFFKRALDDCGYVS